MQSVGCSNEKYIYVNWMEDIESCSKYIDAFQTLKDLFQNNKKFRHDIQETTESALISMKSGRANGNGETQENDIIAAVDIEEGVKYLLKELAFFDVVPHVYTNYEEFVFVYHRSWPVYEKYCSAYYDGIHRPLLGFLVFQ